MNGIATEELRWRARVHRYEYENSQQRLESVIPSEARTLSSTIERLNNEILRQARSLRFLRLRPFASLRASSGQAGQAQDDKLGVLCFLPGIDTQRIRPFLDGPPLVRFGAVIGRSGRTHEPSASPIGYSRTTGTSD